MSFNNFAIGLLAATLVFCLLHWIVRRGTSGGRALSLKRDGVLGVLSLLAVFGTAAVLGATSLWPRLSVNQAMTSYGLMTHVGAGGAFIVALTLLTALWGRRHSECACEVGCARRAMFWLLGTSGLAAALTMLISMTPLFGTHVQHLLFGWHRIAGVVVLASLLGYVYLALTGRRDPRAAAEGETEVEKL
jgi:hypothetical protein